MSAPGPSPLHVAQVTPYPLEHEHPITAHALRLADGLAERGHRVVVLAPAVSPATVRAARRAIAEEGAGVLPEAGAPPRVLAVGEALPPIPGVRRAATLPVDAARALEDLLALLALDLVHVHEPFAPSIAALALRHSHALNAATFHLPTERFVATQVARRRTELLFGRLDVRIATSQATADVVAEHLPTRHPYRILTPPPPPARAGDGPGDAPAEPVEGSGTHAAPELDDPPAARAAVHLVVSPDEERGALRLALRALRRLPMQPAWRATIVTPPGGLPAPALREDLRERVRFVPVAEAGTVPVDADVLLLTSDGTRPAPHALVEGLHAGAVPVASGIPVHEELLAEGERGLLFPVDDLDVLVAQLTRMVAEPTLRLALRDAAVGWAAGRTWDAHLDEVLEAYAGALRRRHDRERFSPAVIARLGRRPLIDVDLHMHTDHSHDCATPVEVLLATARQQGLGAIAVTDHNLTSGALEAAEKAERFGVKVIVGEEVKTAHEGEVIGLFLHETIPKGVGLQEAIDAIHAQGGVVYVPHPFDRLHSVPDYEHLLGVLDDVDAIEVHNPRVAFSSFNEEAARFAGKYRLIAGAGSDSHVAQGLGSVRVRMRDFDGPDEFLASLRDAEIRTRPSSYAYVQALKFLETRATPPAARERRRERRVRRATRSRG